MMDWTAVLKRGFINQLFTSVEIFMSHRLSPSNLRERALTSTTRFIVSHCLMRQPVSLHLDRKEWDALTL